MPAFLIRWQISSIFPWQAGSLYSSWQEYSFWCSQPDYARPGDCVIFFFGKKLRILGLNRQYAIFEKTYNADSLRSFACSIVFVPKVY